MQQERLTKLRQKIKSVTDNHIVDILRQLDENDDEVDENVKSLIKSSSERVDIAVLEFFLGYDEEGLARNKDSDRQAYQKLRNEIANNPAIAIKDDNNGGDNDTEQKSSEDDENDDFLDEPETPDDDVIPDDDVVPDDDETLLDDF